MNLRNLSQEELIKMIKKEGYDYYNFYGITGDFSKDNPLVGLYTFKKSFGGHVVELVGEFEYVISKPMKSLYEIGIKCYNAVKKVRRWLFFNADVAQSAVQRTRNA